MHLGAAYGLDCVVRRDVQNTVAQFGRIGSSDGAVLFEGGFESGNLTESMVSEHGERGRGEF